MQIAPTAPEATRPILRPHQVENAERDIKAAEEKIKSPFIEDKDEVRRQLIRLKKSLRDQAPVPPANGEEEGRLAKRSKELLEYIVSDGMLSQAEMRAAPPGAPDRHLAWEKRNKLRILEWKNIQLRLKPGEQESANLERHRPVVGSMNLDNAFVERKMFHNIEQVSGPAVVFSDEELVGLGALSAEDHARAASMSNEERAVWKRVIQTFLAKAA